MNPFWILTLLSCPDSHPARKLKKMGANLLLDFLFEGFPPEYAVPSESQQDWLNGGVNWEEKYPLDCLGSKEYFLAGVRVR